MIVKNGKLPVFPGILLGLVVFFLFIQSPVKGDEEHEVFNGFARALKGEHFIYHSPHPRADSSLLVRSLDCENFIQWETEMIPRNYKGSRIVFAWMFGIDVNENPHTFDLYINNQKFLTFANPVTNSKRRWNVEGKRGVNLLFHATMVDKYDDLMGFAFLTVPVNLFARGKALKIRIQGETAQSRAWYMTFKYPVSQSATLTAEPAVIENGDKHSQLIRTDIIYLKDRGRAEIWIGNKSQTIPLTFGYNRRFLPVEAVREKIRLPVRISINGKATPKQVILLKPVTPITLYLLPHSHVDVGYTHEQSEVEQIQWQNIRQAIELVEKTRHYPPGSRFKWNTEVMWAVDSYLKHTDQEGLAGFIKTIREGAIELGALHANVMTGLCRPEELVRITRRALTFSRRHHLPLESAMITDIPGMTWGMVQVLAKSGIRYVSMGVNRGHRIGDVINIWGDKPFYWFSPSGKEKIMCWIPRKGYSYFHTGLGANNIEKMFTPNRILAYIEELAETDYPYSIAALHYNIGSDNGPPDPALPDLVKAWNLRYKTPRIRIATVSELFKAFEQRYGPTLPKFRGDFTSHWEDGAASTARETAMNRRSADKLVQASILDIMVPLSEKRSHLFAEAWNKVLMFSEHTWGAWNSISDPHNPFVRNQWRIKRGFALQADKIADQLLPGNSPAAGNDRSPYVRVFNTLSWPRSGLVFLSEKESVTVSCVVDRQGRIVPGQRLSNGQFVFMAKEVPPLGSRLFKLSEQKVPFSGTDKTGGLALNNGSLEIRLDKKKGVIAHLSDHVIGRNLIDKKSPYGFNQYLYVKGRKPLAPLTAKNVRITVKETGPVLTSCLVTGDAEGCKNWQTEITLPQEGDWVDIVHRFDKKAILNPEGVYIAFPFSIPGGQIRINTAWGYYRPGLDQLPGACKNYFSQQRWVDISSKNEGITWCGMDAPLVEIGEITTDATQYGWLKRVTPSTTILSYIMNNYWETNFKAAQPGKVEFVYSIRPHKGFDPVAAERFGMERSNPLQYRWVENPTLKPHESLFLIKNRAVMATYLERLTREDAILIRFYNAGKKAEKLDIDWRALTIGSVFQCNLLGETIRRAADPIVLSPGEFGTMKLVNYKLKASHDCGN